MAVNDRRWFVGDPVQLGLVTNLNKPGGNVTARLGSLARSPQSGWAYYEQFVPNATAISMLVNPANARTEFETNEAREAARTIGWQIQIVNASSDRDFESAFATMIQAHSAGLLVAGGPFFSTRRPRLAALAARHSIPAIYSLPIYVHAGGLMSYGANAVETYRQTGLYAGRILKGEKPADLPVVQPTKFKFIISLKTAKVLGIDVPPMLLALADEVIE